MTSPVLRSPQVEQLLRLAVAKVDELQACPRWTLVRAAMPRRGSATTPSIDRLRQMLNLDSQRVGSNLLQRKMTSTSPTSRSRYGIAQSGYRADAQRKRALEKVDRIDTPRGRHCQGIVFVGKGATLSFA